MEKAKLKLELYKKAFAEQEEYRTWLISQAPEDILKNAYEYATREDILRILEEFSFTSSQYQALLGTNHLIAMVFHAWEKSETDYMTVLYNTVTNTNLGGNDYDEKRSA